MRIKPRIVHAYDRNTRNDNFTGTSLTVGKNVEEKLVREELEKRRE